MSVARPMAPAPASFSTPAPADGSERDEGTLGTGEAEAAKKKGAAEVVTDTRSRTFDLPAPYPQSPPRRSEGRADELGPRAVHGRIVIAKGKRLVVEIEVPAEGLTLALDALVTTLDVGGRRFVAKLVPELSTREGSHAGGQTIRLVFDVELDAVDGDLVSAESIALSIDLGPSAGGQRITAVR